MSDKTVSVNGFC